MQTNETKHYKRAIAILTIATLLAFTLIASIKSPEKDEPCIALQTLKEQNLQHQVDINGKLIDFTEHTGRPECKESP